MSIRIQNHIRNVILAFLLVASMFILAPSTAGAADIQGSLCQGANLEVGGSTDCTTDDPQGKVNDTITFVINIFSIIVGVVAVIMIIVGGLKYITSNGDSNNVTSAKNTILYAIIGLVVVALAQFVVRFVLSKTANA